MIRDGPQGYSTNVRPHIEADLPPILPAYGSWRTHDRVYICEHGACQFWTYTWAKAERHERRTARQGKPGHRVYTDDTQ